MEQDKQRLLRMREVAEYLACDRRTVAKLVKTGQLKAVKVGRDYRFAPEDVEAFMQRQMVSP